MKKYGVIFGGYLDIDYRTALAMAYRMEFIWSYTEAIIEVAAQTNKPLIVVLHMCATGLAKKLASVVQEKLVEANIPVYPSFKRAAAAIKCRLQYLDWMNSGKYK